MTLLDNVRAWMRSASNLARVRALSLEALRPGMKVLEIGPGNGEVLESLLEADRERGLGLDVHALDHLDSLLSRLPAPVQRHLFELDTLKDTGDGLRELPFADGTFDLVILAEVIEHLTFPQIMVAEIARVLRSPDPATGEAGGALVLSTPNIFCLGNRLATLLGTDKVFRRVGSEGFISTISFEPYGHVAHYSYASLSGLLQPWFEITRREASDFHVPGFLYIQPIMTRWFKGLANHIVLAARRRGGPARLRFVPCALTDLTELALPDGRCLHPMPHSRTCNACAYFHKDFLHPRDLRKRADYVPTYR
jgi:SAM-dependent methyltransferase